MSLFSRHGPRIAVALIPLLFALLHATEVLRIDVLQKLDDIIYDARLRATMPRTRDDRIVIVDIDEKSLAEIGRWQWGRDRMAAIARELLDRQKVAILAFDLVFAEPDRSSGLAELERLAAGDLKDQPAFVEKVGALRPALDHDGAFADAIRGRPVVLGYYFSSDRGGGRSGVLPSPVMSREALAGRPIRFTAWNGYGASIAPLAAAAPLSGFFNPIVDGDGVVRSLPMLAEFEGRHYESLSLAIFRRLVGMPAVEPGFPKEKFLSRRYRGLESLILRSGDKTLQLPVDDRVAALIPFRGPGGPNGQSFRYVSAADVLAGRLPAASLKGALVLVGTTAPGLQDLRVTPVGETYPGVETHANILSGLLDGELLVKPDYAIGYDVLVLCLAGLVLAFALPLLSALPAVGLSVAVVAAIVGLNTWLYLGAGLVLPLATALVMAVTAFALNMSWGYFVESRTKRDLAHLFGTYVPPELVDEMVKRPESYGMQAQSRELTVMFSDMRGFTQMSETMEPTQLQGLLNGVFSRLTDVIRAHRGTIDKYMGDCVMAFWGAPVETPRHAHFAVTAAFAMTAALKQINVERRAAGQAPIGIGIGLNTGAMCVGDMGSDVRRSYTVVGDAVNLGARLEGLSKVYGVDIVVSESTRRAAPDFVWQELGRVRVKGKAQAVAIFAPRAPMEAAPAPLVDEIKLWNGFLRHYRAQDWDQAELALLNLRRSGATGPLYDLYAERVAAMRLLPIDPAWDGATTHDAK